MRPHAIHEARWRSGIQIVGGRAPGPAAGSSGTRRSSRHDSSIEFVAQWRGRIHEQSFPAETKRWLCFTSTPRERGWRGTARGRDGVASPCSALRRRRAMPSGWSGCFHDFDYERFPDAPPTTRSAAAEILESKGTLSGSGARSSLSRRSQPASAVSRSREVPVRGGRAVRVRHGVRARASDRRRSPISRYRPCGSG